MTPQRPASIPELSLCLRAAHAARQAVVPVGFGSQQHIGRPPVRRDIELSTRGLTRIVAHEAADMTVTVEAGMSLAELDQVLASAGQFLPIDPPIPENITVGGAIACDANGPWRLAYGKVRDALIGITVVLADGRVVKGGGRVVKNVAGYDLMKLFTGSLGTLGVIAAASFKLRPRPSSTAIATVPMPTASKAAELAARVLREPLSLGFLSVVDALAGAGLGLSGPHLVLACLGSPDEIAVQLDRLSSLAPFAPASDAAATYTALRDLPATLVTVHPLGARFSLLPSRLPALLDAVDDVASRLGVPIASVVHAGNGCVILRAGESDRSPAPLVADTLVRLARQHDAWLTFDHVPDGQQAAVDPWPIVPPAIEWMRGIKRALDPEQLLNPGRFVGGI